MAPPARRGPVDPRLLRYARSSRGFLALSAVITLAQTACIIAFAWLVTALVTGVIDRGIDERFAPQLGALAGVILVRAALVWALERVGAAAAARTGSQLRTAFVDAISRLGSPWLARQNSAALTVTAGHGLDALDVYVARFVPQLVASVIATPIIVAVMWFQDWPSGLTALITLPLIPIFMILIGLATRTVQTRQWRTLHALAARFADTVEGLGTLRLFGRERRAVTNIQTVSDDYRRETMRVLRVTFLSGFMLEFLSSIAVAIIAVSIGLRLLAGDMVLSTGLFVLLLAPEAFLPVRQVGVQFHAAAEGVTATEDVFAVLDEARAVTASAPSPAAGLAPSAADATVTVQGLRVRRDSLLPPVSFTATPGSVTLVRGPSGAGKSSILAALRGAADFEGSVRVDDVDVTTLDPSSWLAWADQRPGLIAGSVADNVALGATEARQADVEWALQTAVAVDVDADLALGVQGAGLSGGQAQRVAVARALYRHRQGTARVIALDEPSSALDAATEAELWRGLRELADDGATVILVSHRRSAAAIADTIVDVSPAPAASEQEVAR